MKSKFFKSSNLFSNNSDGGEDLLSDIMNDMKKPKKKEITREKNIFKSQITQKQHEFLIFIRLKTC